MPNTPFIDGNVVFGNSTAARFTDLEDEINALSRASIRPEGIGYNNGQSPIVTNDSAITNYIRSSATFSDIFEGVYPGYATPTYLGLGTQVGTGWSGFESNSLITFPTHDPALPAVAPYTSGYKIQLNVNVYAIRGPGPGNGDPRWKACFAILWRDGTGAWHIIPRTERDLGCVAEPPARDAIDGRIRCDVAISTFLTPTDLDGEEIQAIQPVVSLYNDGGPAGALSVELADYTFSALPMRVGYP